MKNVTEILQCHLKSPRVSAPVKESINNYNRHQKSSKETPQESSSPDSCRKKPLSIDNQEKSHSAFPSALPRHFQPTTYTCQIHLGLDSAAPDPESRA